MFVRKLKNRSGSISVQIISKKNGEYRVVRTVGTSRDPDETERMFQGAKHDIEYPSHQCKLFAVTTPETRAIESFLDGLTTENIRSIGPELILGTIFNRIGFDAICGDMFRHLVVARLVHPASKLHTVGYLEQYCGKRTSVYSVYRFLDAIQKKHKKKIEHITFEYAKKTVGEITVAFYDMTTLYFEAEDEDNLRKIGFSKEGKFTHPQIMLGLLLGVGGYPIGYDVFEGNVWEGKTLVPTIEKWCRRYDIGHPTIVADAGLLSKENIENLRLNGYPFILGARLKNESERIKATIMEVRDNIDSSSPLVIENNDGIRLIVTYSEKRASRDARNRERGLKRLREQVKSGRLTKKSIGNRGYNKFLRMEGETSISIDEDKIATDKTWDGLKGYLTDTTLLPDEVVEKYSDLWQIEKAFRISKTDLRVRPIFHRVKRRIEAHLVVAFAAYVVYKELERLLKENKAAFSVKQAIELTKTMYEIVYLSPEGVGYKKKLIAVKGDQKKLREIVCGD